jgi:hypothetical protein
MKLYSLSPQASIKMADDPKLVNILKESLYGTKLILRSKQELLTELALLA